ncbi:hypothetical protein GXP67_35230 [Rhodocytophaga rosea]|uniref:Uncharacterized protein n=1 Tax=Rhodocytophaga rosea TaxID=2704465 RepID=A0A6C0GU31_9BACT|nr:hypothetical protein [Rhodocytophaga rosea]QHT71546.1 hypothetical protein GXP67_35230 [Rhodocytophaga rosea]
MKTIHYNPSLIEVEFAKIIADLKEEIQKKSAFNTIEEIENNSTKDNPHLVFNLIDTDGDRHELIVQFIQRMDE